MEVYDISETRNHDAHMIEGTDLNSHFSSPNLERTEVMANEGAPEFYVDQNMYYPIANNYGYYCTGFETPGEWEDHHRIFGVDGPNVQYTGAQNESLPYVYYSYGYAQSPYNPYNPYIPGAMIGADGSFGGGQHYYTLPNYQNPVSAPGYIPLVPPDNFYDSSADSFFGANASVSKPDGRGLKHKFNSASGNFSRNSSKFLSNQTSSLARVSEGPRGNDGRKQDLTHASVSGSSFLNLASPAVHQGHGGNHRAALHLAVRKKLGQWEIKKAKLPTSSTELLVMRRKLGQCGVRKPKLPTSSTEMFFLVVPLTQAPGSIFFAKLRPKLHPGSKVPSGGGNGSSDILGEQNRGPRVGRSKNQLSVKAYTTVTGDGNEQGNIVIYTDQYNKEDFSLDYENAKFFVIKSYSEDDVHKSIKYNVWSSTPHGNKKLENAYEDAQKIAAEKSGVCPIFLFFSVNASGQFCGVAEMVGTVDFNKNMDFWQQDKWNGSFPVKWHFIKDVPNPNFRHIILENNENKPVTNSRDTQEIVYLKGLEMLKIFKNHTLKTSLLDDFIYYESRQKIMQDEKAKLLGKNFDSPIFVPVMEAPPKLNFTSTGNYEKNLKPKDDSDGLKQIPVSSLEQIPSNSSGTSIKPVDEKADKTVAKDISSILKIGSVTIAPKQVEAKQSISIDNKEPVDVLTVGSMKVKVNGFGSSSGFLKVGSIPLDGRALQSGKGDASVKTGSQR
ncbi:YTH domain-containing protein ECT4-like isoform X2 [Vigna unguiculata]|uniref:YTH domain-containing protein ECT4-like isoform X2 n=1 Tax=Vigna unguiculata TaxID=3917 RepID=UPI001015D649|nr:YTH domain-containing protein ECT4-like isoform X2 [Vigna unguiculata]